MPRTIYINRALLPTQFKKHRYMLGSDGSQDYMCQILHNLGIDVPPEHRTPADLQILIPPFTFELRGVVANSKLTLSILALDRTLPQEHPRKLREMLSPAGFELVWIRKREDWMKDGQFIEIDNEHYLVEDR
jgi:hypothetical protein